MSAITAPNQDMTGIVRHITKIYYEKLGRSIPFEDLEDAGRKGLLYACRYFQPDRDCKWTSFASMVIKQRICKFISDKLDYFNHKSLYEPDENLIDTSVEPNEFDYDREDLDDLLRRSNLSIRHKHVFDLRRQGKGYKDIGLLMSISHERSRQIVQYVIESIKSTIKQGDLMSIKNAFSMIDDKKSTFKLKFDSVEKSLDYQRIMIEKGYEHHQEEPVRSKYIYVWQNSEKIGAFKNEVEFNASGVK